MMITRKLRQLTDEDIRTIATTIDAFEAGTLTEEKGFCTVVSTEDIAKQDFILIPGRYVGIVEQMADTEHFEDKIARLTGELSGLFEQSHRLEDEIKQQLESIGFKI